MGVRLRGKATQGFTLVELLVVILIIGILIAVAAPSFLGQTQKAHDSASQQYLTVAYKDATAAAVSNSPQGYFVTGASHPDFTLSDLRDAIQSGEPGLAVTLADDSDLAHSCPQIASGQPDNAVFIDSAGTHGNNLVMCSDPNGRVWTLTVENGVLQPFPQTPYTGSSQPIVIAPTSISAPALSGTAQIGASLSTSTGSWANSPTGYSYTWQSSPSADFSGTVTTVGTNASSYTATSADQGDYLRVSVQASNSAGSAARFSNASNAVLPLAPTNSVLPTFSGTIQVGQTLTADHGTWSDFPTGYTYTWRTSLDGATWSPVGTDSSTYVVQTTDVGATPDTGKHFQICVQATNDGGTSSAGAACSATSASVASPMTPVNTGAPTVSGTAQVNQTLTTTDGTWTSQVSLTPSYKWYRCTDNTSTPPTNCVSIGGATSSTYTAASSDINNYLRSQVTETDTYSQSGSAYSAASALVVGIAPSNSGGVNLPAISGAVAIGNTLSSTNGSWTGTPTSYTWTWQNQTVGGSWTPISGATGSGASVGSYTITLADFGDNVRVSVTATNAGGTSSAAVSNALTVGPVNLAYQSLTWQVSGITATSAASAQTVMDAPAFTADGVQTVAIEAYVPRIDSPGAGSDTILALYDNGTLVQGRFGELGGSGAEVERNGITATIRLVPSAGSHQYGVRAWVTPGGPGSVNAGTGIWQPGFVKVTSVTPTQLAYQEATAPVGITASSGATAQTVVTASAITANGSTPMQIEFFSPRVDSAPVANTDLAFALYDNGVEVVDRWGENGLDTATSMHSSEQLGFRITPSAGSHVYSVRAWQPGGNGTTAYVDGGSGGSGFAPAHIAIDRVSPFEQSYTTYAAQTTVSATSAATAQTVVTAPSLSADGSTSYDLDFFVPRLDSPSPTSSIVVQLYDNGTAVGYRWDDMGTSGSIVSRSEAMPSWRVTPTAGAHVYSVRSWTTGGTGYLSSGVSVWPVGYLQLARVSP